MAGLLDDKQSISGLLVDLYENPVINTAIGFTPVLGDVQSGYETANSLRKRNYGEAALNALGLLPYVPSLGKLAAAKGMLGMAGAIKASHGTPHKFDAFDFSKMGTGEGAQAYGHGGYFAQGFDSPVAAEYQRALAGKEGLQATIGKQPIYDFYKSIEDKANRLPVQQAQSEYEKLAFLEDLDQQPSFQEALKRIDDESIIPWAKSLENQYQPAGNMYNVSLEWPDAAREAADPLGEHHLLDWDKELAKQPKNIKDILKQEGVAKGYRENLSDFSTPMSTRNRMARGENILSYLEMVHGGPEQASAYLNSIGIPGIRYLDQGSRAAGRGSHNYVIFDDKIPKIVSRNGKTLLED